MNIFLKHIKNSFIFYILYFYFCFYVSSAFVNNTTLYLTFYIYVDNVYMCCIDISDYWICGRSGVSYHLLERRARSMVLEHEDKISHPTTLSFAFAVQSLNTALSPRSLRLPCYFMTMHFPFHLSVFRVRNLNAIDKILRATNTRT